MKSRTTERFQELLEALPESVQEAAKEAFKLFEADPTHPGLHFEQIETKIGACYSARVGLHYRALARRKPDCWLWFWIGSHAEYNRLLK